MWVPNDLNYTGRLDKKEEVLYILAEQIGL